MFSSQKPKITYQIDVTRQGIAFTADGDSNLQARVMLRVAGALTPLESTPLADSFLSDSGVRKKSGLAAYERLLSKLNETAADLVDAEKTARLALEVYTSTVALGGEVEARRGELADLWRLFPDDSFRARSLATHGGGGQTLPADRVLRLRPASGHDERG